MGRLDRDARVCIRPRRRHDGRGRRGRPARAGGPPGRGAFALVAAGLPVATLLVFRHLFAADARALPVVEMARLRALPIFAPLGAPALEGLAREVLPVEATAGTTIVAEGETGDRFYVVVDGDLQVSTGRVLHRGDSFGEIALLRDVPRTATVQALTAVRLDALDKETFLAAVTGHPGSRRAADAVVQALLH